MISYLHILKDIMYSKKSTQPLFKALSKDYFIHLSFGEIRQSESELIKAFNVNQFPHYVLNYRNNMILILLPSEKAYFLDLY